MPKKKTDKNLFQKLTQLFRSGPQIKRRIKGIPSTGSASTMQLFGHAAHDAYNNTMSTYGSFDRMSRYSDFSEMEATPEISAALDIYSEEATSVDEKGVSLHIHSDNRKVKEILDTLFYDTLNIEFNMTMWVRNLCKYGDFFLFTDVSPEYGVINAFPIAISEIEREEGFDPDDPAAVRYRWVSNGNQVLENWQVTHFRLLGNDAFLPYGSSVLEPARRIWRQLILIEDAMLVYRVIRAPERRVFYIDVGNVPPENVAEYLEQAQSSLKRSAVVDSDTGRVDLRYNPMSVDEDYFLPVRGGESGTKIDTLSGGQNTAAIEDVEYIQKKLFAALKIPRAYLGYDEDIGSKATLAQEDIRFSRTIQRIQKTIIAELNKLAMVHLFSHGYDGEDLLDFDLLLSNPSSVAQQQKLELIRARFEIAGTAPEGMVDRRWIRKNVMGLTDDEIRLIEEGKVEDKVSDLELEATQAPGSEGGGGDDAGGDDLFGGGDDAGGDDLGGDDAGGEDLFAADYTTGDLLTALPADSTRSKDTDDDEDDDDHVNILSIDDEESPARAQKQIRNAFNEPISKSRKVRFGPATTHMPDFLSMTSTGSSTRKQDTSNQPFDNDFFKDPFKENFSSARNVDPGMDEFLDTKITQHAKMTREIESTLGNLSSAIGINVKRVISEGPDVVEGGIDLDITLDHDEDNNK
jgi:hypothetical protein